MDKQKIFSYKGEDEAIFYVGVGKKGNYMIGSKQLVIDVLKSFEPTYNKAALSNLLLNERRYLLFNPSEFIDSAYSFKESFKISETSEVTEEDWFLCIIIPSYPY